MRNQKKQCIVIGLNNFWESICNELARQGHGVVAVDIDEKQIDHFKDAPFTVICLDPTDSHVLQKLDVNQFDFGVVAMGSDIEASILTAINLKDLGVPKLWAKASTPQHRQLLEKLGVDHVVQPETNMGVRIAQNMLSESFVDFISLSNKYSIVEFIATEQLTNKTIEMLSLKKRYHLNLVAVQSADSINFTPMPTDTINSGDLLIIIGLDKDIQRFSEAEL